MKKANLMYQHLKACEHFASKDPYMVYLNSVHVVSEKNIVKYEATDGYRLLSTSHETNVDNDEINVIIPKEMIKKLKATATDLKGSLVGCFDTSSDKSLVEVCVFDDGKITLSFQDVCITGSCIDATYPDTSRAVLSSVVKGKKRADSFLLNSNLLKSFADADKSFILGRGFRQGFSPLNFTIPNTFEKPIEITISSNGVNHRCGDKFKGLIIGMRP